MNFACSLCILKEASWTCDNCAGTKLCPSCVQVHLSKKTVQHLLRPLEDGTMQGFEGSEGIVEKEIRRLEETQRRVWEELEGKEREVTRKVVEKFKEKRTELEEIFNEGKKYLEGLKNTGEIGEKLFDLSINWCENIEIGDILTISFIRTLTTEKIYTNGETLKGKWTYNGRKIDAISLSVSSPIYLTALDFPPLYRSSPAVVLKTLEIVEGQSTNGKVIYSQGSTAVEVGETSRVRLNNAVGLEAERVYTVKTVLEGGVTAAIGEVSADHSLFRLLPTEFAGGDVSNMSSPTAGIYLAFHYFT